MADIENANVTNGNGNDAATEGNGVTEQKTEKTFTQTELDAIISDRLKREREKTSDYEALKAKAAKYDELEEANKSELEKANEKASRLETELNALKKAREIEEIRAKAIKDNNVPSEWSDFITGETAEDCEAQAKKIMERISPNGYPNVRDGGEVHNTSNGKTRDLFDAWMESNGL